MSLGNSLYDFLKSLAQIFIPALATLYFALGLPAAEQVLGGLAAADTLLGVILGIAHMSFNKSLARGIMVVTKTEKGLVYSLELDEGPEVIPDRKQVRLNVVKEG